VTKSQLIKVRCPQCGAQNEFARFDTVNVTLNPELKEKVIDSSLFQVTCSRCRKKTNYLHNLLYHDMQKRAAIWLIVPDEQGRFEIEEDTFGEDYCNRIVPTWQELVEKIACLDSGWDDYIIEYFKLLILLIDPTKNEEPITFKGCIKDENGINLVVCERYINGERLLLKHMVPVLIQVRSDIFRKLPPLVDKCDAWLHVDQGFIRRLIFWHRLWEQDETDYTDDEE